MSVLAAACSCLHSSCVTGSRCRAHGSVLRVNACDPTCRDLSVAASLTSPASRERAWEPHVWRLPQLTIGSPDDGEPTGHARAHVAVPPRSHPRCRHASLNKARRFGCVTRDRYAASGCEGGSALLSRLALRGPFACPLRRVGSMTADCVPSWSVRRAHALSLNGAGED